MGSALWMAKNVFLEPCITNMKNLSVLMVLLAMAFPFKASAATLNGDVNGDSFVNIVDVTALTDYLLSGDDSQIMIENADVYADGLVNVMDVTALIDLILSGPQVEPDENYVDLGLPSGTLWATRNVGAENPEDYGDYFAWGEVEPKDYYHGSTYVWNDSETNTIHLSKYCTKENNGIVDNKTVLDPEDDAARVNYPNGQTPSMEQFNELKENCTWAWSELNGVVGLLVTGTNGNTMFLPAAGYRLQSKAYSTGVQCNYWLNSIVEAAPLNGYKMYATSSVFQFNSSSRQIGYTVRAVRAAEE